MATALVARPVAESFNGAAAKAKVKADSLLLSLLLSLRALAVQPGPEDSAQRVEESVEFALHSTALTARRLAASEFWSDPCASAWPSSLSASAPTQPTAMMIEGGEETEGDKPTMSISPR